MFCRRFLLPVAAFIGVVLLCGCGPTTSPPSATTTGVLELTSAAFAQGEMIPQTYTCDGQDISPPLSWGDPPEGTESFALISEDPDAPVGTWVHWVLFNVPADKRSLSEDVPAEDQLPDGGLHGRNRWKRRDYGGPCPPSGSTHRYVFRLFALDTALDLEVGATKKQVLSAMDGHVLAQGELTGEYSR